METTKIIEKAFCYFSPVGKGIIPFPVDTIRHFEINKDIKTLHGDIVGKKEFMIE